MQASAGLVEVTGWAASWGYVDTEGDFCQFAWQGSAHFRASARGGFRDSRQIACAQFAIGDVGGPVREGCSAAATD